MKKAVCLAGAMILAIPFGFVTAASAEVIKLQADLKGSNEVPPNTSSGSGKAEATFDTDTKLMTYTVTFANLTGPAVAAHLHGPSEPGKNAGIALPLKSSQSPVQGTATLSDTQSADLLAGKWYVNIHTAANPGGEVRGQMTK
jgi:hypothetical protein